MSKPDLHSRASSAETCDPHNQGAQDAAHGGISRQRSAYEPGGLSLLFGLVGMVAPMAAAGAESLLLRDMPAQAPGSPMFLAFSGVIAMVPVMIAEMEARKRVEKFHMSLARGKRMIVVAQSLTYGCVVGAALFFNAVAAMSRPEQPVPVSQVHTQGPVAHQAPRY